MKLGICYMRRCSPQNHKRMGPGDWKSINDWKEFSLKSRINYYWGCNSHPATYGLMSWHCNRSVAQHVELWIQPGSSEWERNRAANFHLLSEASIDISINFGQPPRDVYVNCRCFFFGDSCESRHDVNCLSASQSQWRNKILLRSTKSKDWGEGKDKWTGQRDITQAVTLHMSAMKTNVILAIHAAIHKFTEYLGTE